MKRAALAAAVTLAIVPIVAVSAQGEWLSWSAQKAQGIGQSTYVQGRVGPLFDGRLLDTDRAHNYKLAATLFTGDVIHAAARRIQLVDRLSDAAALELVAAARLDGWIVMVEIDPREGSGVIPNGWSAFLQPIAAGRAGRPIRGTNHPALRDNRVLSGVRRRDYDYDRFWVVFPSRHDDGTSLLPVGTTHVELVVRIYDREGKVRWPAP